MTPRKQPVAESPCALLLTGAYLLRITKLLFLCFCLSLLIFFIHLFFESICPYALLAKPCFASIPDNLRKIFIRLFSFLVYYIWLVWYTSHLNAKIKNAIANGSYPVDLEKIADSLMEAYKELK